MIFFEAGTFLQLLKLLFIFPQSVHIDVIAKIFEEMKVQKTCVKSVC